MPNNIEVELRGPLTREQFVALEDILKKDGQFKTVKKRILLDYSTYLPEEGIASRNRDIRLRVTNNIPEIIVKLGKWGGEEHRQELSVATKPGEFDKLVRIFAALGFKRATLCIRKSQVYDYKGIEFALVEVPRHSFYFEAEKMAAPGADEEKIKQEIRNVCLELGLNLFDDQRFFAYMDALNQEANEVFDFANYQEDYFKNRFNLK